MEALTDLQVLVGLVALVAGPAGSAWVAVKVALNGARADIREIKHDVKNLHSRVTDATDRVSRLEGRGESR